MAIDFRRADPQPTTPDRWTLQDVITACRHGQPVEAGRRQDAIDDLCRALLHLEPAD